VRSAIERGAVACWVNLGEVLYLETRRQGAERAEEAISSLAAILRAEEVDGDLARAAARVKAQGRASYADCFAVATAERHGVPLLTGDPEIVALDREHLQVVDLRPTAA
jgi:predicted nucleic acid-binding protein